MALDRARFGSNDAAWLHHVGSLDPAQASSLLREALTDGTWLRAPDAWSSAAWGLSNAGTWSRADLAVAVAEALTRLPQTEEQPVFHRFFSDVVRILVAEDRLRPLEALVGWFLKHAKPGDAAVAAAALEQAQCATTHAVPGEVLAARDPARHSRGVAPLFPLAVWLLENGAAVLRGEKASVLPFLAELATTHEPKRAIDVLRYLSSADRVRVPSARMRDASMPPPFWPAMECALAAGAPDELLIGLAMRLVRESNWSPSEAVAPLADNAWPGARAALARCLFAGRLTDPLEDAAFDTLCELPATSFSELTFGELTHVVRLVDRLAPRLRPGWAQTPPRAGASAFEWAQRVLGDYLRLVDLRAGGVALEAARERLLQWSRFPQTAAPLRVALCQALEQANDVPGAALAADALRQGPGDGAMRAALLLLQPPSLRSRTVDDAAVAELRAWLETLVHRPWLEPIGGVDVGRLLRGATRVEFDTLPNDDKVKPSPPVLIVDLETMRAIAAVPDPDRRQILAATYLFHELVHVAQGIGDKERVLRLRATGSETTLMHLDLAADHAAARLAHAAVPRHSLAQIKDVQGRSLVKFPVGWMHTAASRARKALRLVSLRLDFAIRAGRLKGAALQNDAYAFVDHGPAGGFLLALTSGPPPAVLADATLTNDEAKVLESAADVGVSGDATIARVDAILERLAVG